MKTLTDDNKTTYLNLGLRLVGIQIDNQTTELVWRVYDGILKKKGNFSLLDSIRIELQVTGTYKQKEITLFESQKVKAIPRTKALIYGRFNKDTPLIK